MKNEEKELKRWLKRKMSFTLSLLVTFLITGMVGYAQTDPTLIKYFSVKSTDGENTNNDGATAQDAIAIGKNAKAGIAKNHPTDGTTETNPTQGSGKESSKRTGAIAIGVDTLASGSQIAIGKGAKFEHSMSHWADGYSGIAIGENALSRGPHMAIGQNSRVQGNIFSIALGESVDVDAQSGTGIGYKTRVYSNQGIAIGYDAQSGNQWKDDFIAALKNENDVGFKAYISNGYESGTSGIAIGYGTRAEGQSGVALGSGAKSLNFANTAIGENAYASGSSAQVFGAGSKGTGNLSLATGYGAFAAGKISSVFGSHAQAHGYGSTAIGYHAFTGKVLTEEEYQKVDENLKNAYTELEGWQLGKYKDNEMKAKFYLLNDTQNSYYATAVGTATIALERGTTLGGASSAGKDSVSVGYGANTAEVENSVAIGGSAKLLANNAIAIGTRAGATKDAVNSVSLGAGSSSATDGGVALGYLSTATVAKEVVGYDPITMDHRSVENVATKKAELAAEVERLQNEYDTAEKAFRAVADPHNANVDKLYSLNREKEQLEDKKRSILRDLDSHPDVTRPNPAEYDSTDEYNKAVEKRKEVVNKKMEALKELYTKSQDVDSKIKEVKKSLDDSIKKIVAMPEYQGRGKLLVDLNAKKYELSKLNATWVATAGAVSVGNSEQGITRQITNLAAGTNDTDAVNVAQLKALQNATPMVYTDDQNNLVKKGIDNKFYPTDAVYMDGNYYPAGTVKIDNQYYPAGAVKGEDGVVKVGDNPTTAVSPLEGKNAGTVTLSAKGTDGTVMHPVRISNIADGTGDSDAVNKKQMDAAIAAAAGKVQYFSVNSEKEGNRNNDGAKLIHLPDVKTDSIAIGPNVSAASMRSVAIGNNTHAGAGHNVSIGGDSQVGYGPELVKGLSRQEQINAMGRSAYSASVGSNVITGVQTQSGGKTTTKDSAYSQAFGHGNMLLGANVVAAVGTGSAAVNSERGAMLGSYLTNVASSRATTIGASARTFDSNESISIGSLYWDNEAKKLKKAQVLTSNGAMAIGSGASVFESNNAVVLGKNAHTTNSDNAVIIGRDASTTNVVGAVTIGAKSSTLVDDGVALGSGSVANVDRSKIAYMPGLATEEAVYASVTKDKTWLDDINGKISSTKAEMENAAQALATASAAKMKAIEDGLEYLAEDSKFVGALRDANTTSRDKLLELQKKYGLSDEKFEALITQVGAYNEKLTAYEEAKKKYTDALTEKQNGITEELRQQGVVSSAGAMSIGSAERKRQITNVAGGTEDTDAVNVAQLKGAVKLTNNLQNATGLTDDEIAKINDPTAKDKPKTLIERVDDVKNNGSVVYVDPNDKDKKPMMKGEDGKFYPVDSVKGKDGKFYPAGTTFNGDGQPTSGEALTGKEANTLVALVKNADGTTTVSTRLTNIADGINNNDAVNKKQMDDAIALATANANVKYYGIASKSEKANLKGDQAKGDNVVVIGPGNMMPTDVAGTVQENRDTTVIGAGNKIQYVKYDKYEKASHDATQMKGNIYSTTVVGNKNKVTEHQTTVVGTENEVFAKESVVVGNKIKTSSDARSAVSIGFYSAVEGYAPVAVGDYARAKAGYGVAIGKSAEVTGRRSVSLGAMTTATVADGVALGYKSAADVRAGKYAYAPDGMNGMNTEVGIAEYLGKLEEYKELKARVDGAVEIKALEEAYRTPFLEYMDLEGQINVERAKMVDANTLEDRQKIIDRINELHAQRKEKEVDYREKEKLYKAHSGKDQYEKDKKALSELLSVMRSSGGAVSVGNSAEGIKRQITNVAGGTEDSDAVNVAQLKSVVKIVKNGPVTYVDPNDENKIPLWKAPDGKYYPVDAVQGKDGKYYPVGTTFGEDGQPTSGEALTGKDADTLVALVKNADGTTTASTRLTNIADGVNDNDAVNKKQMDKAIKIAVKDNSDLYEDKTNEKGEIVDKDNKPLVKDETDGKYYPKGENGQPNKDNGSVEPARVLKGINFAGNEGSVKRTLGDTFNIEGAKGEADKVVTDGDYSSLNTTTKVHNNKLHILFSDKPKFKEVTLNNGNANAKDTIIKPDNEGNLLINDNKIATINDVNNASVKYFSVNSTKEGNKDGKGATGNDAIAIGAETAATKRESIAVGYKAKTSGDYAIAMGESSNAAGDLSIAIGSEASTKETSGVAIGYAAKANKMSTAIGMQANAGDAQFAQVYGAGAILSKLKEGENKVVSGKTITVGRNSASGSESTNNITVNNVGITDDEEANLRGKYGDLYLSMAIGTKASAHDMSAIAIGSFSTATHKSSMALGSSAEALAKYAVAIGDNSISASENSIAIGRNSEALVSDTKNGKAVYSNEDVKGKMGVVSFGKNTDKRRVINIAGGIDDNDAVNVKQLKALAKSTGLTDEDIAKINANATDKPKTLVERINELSNVVGADGKSGLNGKVGDPGKDGEDGRNGTNGLDGTAAADGKEGPAGKDGLNGQDLNSKVNALRRGEAGTVVYTDADGNRLVKAEDGKMYKADQVNPDGKLKDAGAKAVEAENIRLSTVNADGSTAKSTQLGNIAAGTKDTDAVNVKQLKDAVNEVVKKDTIGNSDLYEDEKDANGNKIDKDGNPINDKGQIIDPKTKEPKNPNDKGGREPARVLKGINFAGNTGEVKKTLGDKFEIVGAKGEADKVVTDGDYSSLNTATKVDGDKLHILFSDKPSFKEVTVKDKTDGPATSIIPGSVTVSNGKDGADGKTSSITPEGFTVKDGKDGENGKAVYGKDGISITGPKGENGADGKTTTIKVDKDGDVVIGKDGKDGADGKVITKSDLDKVIEASSKVDEYRISEVEKRVNQVEKDSRRGTAHALAQGGVKFQEIGVNEIAVGAALGYYKGERAIAVGVQGAPSQNTRVHGTVSLIPGSQTEAGVSVGASWKFNFK